MHPLALAIVNGIKRAAVIAVGKKVKRTVTKVVDGIDTGEKEEVDGAVVSPAKAGSWLSSVLLAIVAYLVATNKVDPALGELLRELIAVVAPGLADALQAIALPEATPQLPPPSK